MESDLLTRISAIRNSEEYKRLGTKSRGKHEKSRFDILNNQINGLETQLNNVRKANAAARETSTSNTTPPPITIQPVNASALRDNTRGESDAIKQYADMIKSEIDKTRQIRLSLQTFDPPEPKVARTEEIEPNRDDELPDLSPKMDADENPEFWNKLDSLNFTITDQTDGTF